MQCKMSSKKYYVKKYFKKENGKTNSEKSFESQVFSC